MRERADARGLCGGAKAGAGEGEEEGGGGGACLETSWVSSLRVMEM